MTDTNNPTPSPEDAMADPDFRAAMDAIKPEEKKASDIDLRRILDIPMMVSVELGRNKMAIQDLLQLGPGSVVELSKLAGEPLDIYVHGRLIARGEAVVVNDKFGVRLTDIVSPRERLEKLREG